MINPHDFTYGRCSHEGCQVDLHCYETAVKTDDIRFFTCPPDYNVEGK